MKRVTDLENERLSKTPCEIYTVFAGSLMNQGYTISQIQLRKYVDLRRQGNDDQYTQSVDSQNFLITAFIVTDKGSIEMKYLEGPNVPPSLESVASFLLNYAGISSLVNRGLIELMSSTDREAN
jgi:hypothetical protein